MAKVVVMDLRLFSTKSVISEEQTQVQRISERPSQKSQTLSAMRQQEI